MKRAPAPLESEQRFESLLAHVLRWGVVLSALIIACGGAVFLRHHGLDRPEYHTFRGEPGTLRTVRGIVSRASHRDGAGLVQLGLLALIGTPIARVVFSVVGFARQRDWLYVSMTVTVLALLTYALAGG